MRDTQPRRRGALLAALALGWSCGGSSNAEVRPDGGSGGIQVQTGAGGATADAGGVPGTGGASGGCPAQATFTQGEHITMAVTWMTTLGTMMGTGQVHVWAKTTFTASGNTLTGTSQTCGSVLPATNLNAIAGGGTVLIQIPDATWEVSTMPRFQIQATQTGWDVGSVVSYTSTALIGLTLADPTNGAWPDPVTTAVDADDDKSPGYTAVPASGGSYVLPPTSINTASNRADRVYLATRNVFMIAATRTACDQASGPVTVVHFDSHVVGCHNSTTNMDCTPQQASFVDTNRTDYTAGTSTIQTKVVPANATCADVRTALPM